MNAEVVSRLQVSFDVPVLRYLEASQEKERIQRDVEGRLRELSEAQGKTILAQEKNLIALANYVLDAMEALPEAMRNQRVKAAAEFALSLDPENRLLALYAPPPESHQ